MSSVVLLDAIQEAATSEENSSRIGSLKALSFISVAFAVCAFYDFLLKLKNEVEILGPAFHWRQIQSTIHDQKTEWSWARFNIRIVYLVGRYVGIAHQIYMAVALTRQSVEITVKVRQKFRTSLLSKLCLNAEYFSSCRTFSLFNGFLATVVLCAMQGLIALRIYRSLGRFNPMGKKLLKVAFVLQLVALFVMQAIASVRAEKLGYDGNSVGICSAEVFPDWTYTIWVPVLCFEVLLLALATRAVWEHYRVHRLLRSTNTERYGRTKTSAVVVILRDSVVSLLVLVAICLVNLIGHRFIGNVVPVPTSFALSTLGPIVLGSQLLANLHHARNVADPADDMDNGVELRVTIVVPQQDSVSDIEGIPDVKGLRLYDPSA